MFVVLRYKMFYCHYEEISSVTPHLFATREHAMKWIEQEKIAFIGPKMQKLRLDVAKQLVPPTLAEQKDGYLDMNAYVSELESKYDPTNDQSFPLLYDYVYFQKSDMYWMMRYGWYRYEIHESTVQDE